MAERKKYITVKTPILNSEMRVLGTPDELHNKTIQLDLTRKLKGKGLNMKLRIFNVEGKLFAIPNKMELTISYIRRMMRKRTDYVEDSFSTRCKDVKVIIKPFLITRKKVSRAVRRNLRNTAREFIIGYAKEKDYIEFCNDLLDQTFSRALLPKLKKVYPLSFCDLRVFETKEIEKIDLEKAISVEEEVESEDKSTEEVVEEAMEVADTEESEEKVEEKVEEEAVEEAVDKVEEESD